MSKSKKMMISVFLMSFASFALQFFWMPYYGSVNLSVSYLISRYSFFLFVPLPILLYVTIGTDQPVYNVWYLLFGLFGIRVLCDVCCWGLMKWQGNDKICIPYIFDSLHIFMSAFVWYCLTKPDKNLLRSTLKKKLPYLLFLVTLLSGFICIVQGFITKTISKVAVQGSELYIDTFSNINLLLYAGAGLIVLLSVMMCLLAFSDIVPVVETISRLNFAWFMLFPVILFFLLQIKAFVYPDHLLARISRNTLSASLEFEMEFENAGNNYPLKRKLYRVKRRLSREDYIDAYYCNISILTENRSSTMICIPPRCYRFNMEDAEAGIYSPYYILIYKDKEPLFFEVDKLSSTAENEVLTMALKHQDALSDFLLFPYAAAYLIKYEPEFIIPYLQRYAEEKFTEDEVRMLGDVRPEYIRDVSIKLLGN